MFYVRPTITPTTAAPNIEPSPVLTLEPAPVNSGKPVVLGELLLAAGGAAEIKVEDTITGAAVGKTGGAAGTVIDRLPLAAGGAAGARVEETGVT